MTEAIRIEELDLDGDEALDLKYRFPAPPSCICLCGKRGDDR